MRSAIVSVIGVAALLAIIGAGTIRAHEGHDHGPQPAPTRPDAAPRGEASSPEFELVAVAQGAELVIFVDRFRSNEPVLNATVEVETPAGPATATAASGAYRMAAPWLTAPGHVDLIATVTADGTTDVLPVSIDIPDGAATPAKTTAMPALVSSLLQPATAAALGFGVIVGVALAGFGRRRRTPATAIALAAALSMLSGPGSADEAVAPSAGTDRASRAADGVVFVPKPIQRIFGVRTIVTAEASHPRSVELPGRIIPDPNSSGYVQASVGGRLSALPGGFPRLGTPVRKGDVLALVTPPMQAIDVSDMRQRQGELDQQIAIVGRRVARYQALSKTGAVARAQLEDAQMELDGLNERRASLDHIRLQPESLIAPVDGVVAEGTPIAGQMAQPNAIVFQIVDPAKLWVEALSFDAIGGEPNATAITANGRSLPLAFRGSGLADRNQSIPVHFAIEGDTGSLRAGQFVTVFVTTGKGRNGIAIPRTSLVRSAGGQELVYVHTGAERFEARPVRTEPLDGERVLVSAGVEPGQRVVIQGAELLDHVR